MWQSHSLAFKVVACPDMGSPVPRIAPIRGDLRLGLLVVGPGRAHIARSLQARGRSTVVRVGRACDVGPQSRIDDPTVCIIRRTVRGSASNHDGGAASGVPLGGARCRY